MLYLKQDLLERTKNKSIKCVIPRGDVGWNINWCQENSGKFKVWQGHTGLLWLWLSYTLNLWVNSQRDLKVERRNLMDAY